MEKPKVDETEKVLETDPEKYVDVKLTVADSKVIAEPEPPYFATKIRVEYVDGFSWLLLEDLVYYSLLMGRIQIPSAFTTDFNSVPRPFWRLFPKTQYGPAAVVHDYLCNYGLNMEPKIDRALADRIFVEALEICGAPWWKRKIMYLGVRIGALL